MQKSLILAAAAAAMLTAPALAGESETTLDYVIEKGVVLSVSGFEIPVMYHADGTYTAEAMGSEIPGTWRIDGASLCTESSMQPGETCTEYPEDMGPGDSFEVMGAMGPATITINE
ncbi:MAG: hypothetical protein CMK09_15660 [Ponticaulis sp.]|nr:hypothetical protein [Ponticaulis sp.]